MSIKDFQQKAVDQFESEELRGMTIRKTRAIECIVNEKGETHYYKIKATAQEETYLGAIPLTATTMTVTSSSYGTSETKHVHKSMCEHGNPMLTIRMEMVMSASLRMRYSV